MVNYKDEVSHEHLAGVSFTVLQKRHRKRFLWQMKAPGFKELAIGENVIGY
jgi:hypothetical protein